MPKKSKYALSLAMTMLAGMLLMVVGAGILKFGGSNVLGLFIFLVGLITAYFAFISLDVFRD